MCLDEPQSWKSNCYSGGTNGCNESSWTIFDPAPGASEGPIAPNGNLRPERERLLSRVHMRGTVGPAKAYFFNTTDQTFYLHVGEATAQDAELLHPQYSLPDLLALHDGVHIQVEAYTPAVVLSVSSSTPAHIISAVETAINANGSLTQVYIPRGVSWNVTVTGAAVLSSVVLWPDGSRSALVLPSLPQRAYSVFIGPPGWEPASQTTYHASTWDVRTIIEESQTRLLETDVLRHGIDWCREPPSDWDAVKLRLDDLVRRNPEAALPRLMRLSQSQRTSSEIAADKLTDPVDALVTYVSAVAQLRDAMCGFDN